MKPTQEGGAEFEKHKILLHSDVKKINSLRITQVSGDVLSPKKENRTVIAKNLRVAAYWLDINCLFKIPALSKQKFFFK